MEVINCTTAIYVKDIEVSKNFYSNIMNLAVDQDLDKYVLYKVGFAIWQLEESHMVAQKIGLSHTEDQSVQRFELFFETWNLMEVYGRLKGKNVEFLHGIHEETWGQLTIRFYDPDHHLIEVGEFQEQFVNRMYKEGKIAEEIMAKTHMSYEKLKTLILGLK